MQKAVTVYTKQDVSLEEYFVIRGIVVVTNQQKKVISERELETEPTREDIAQFLVETGADFASVLKNYRLIKE